jgi:hypothetical protein
VSLRDIVKKKRRLEIVVETERRVTLRRFGPLPVARCEQCSGPMVFAEQAVAATGLSSRALHRLVETGEVHFAETPAGALLICPNSFTSGAGEAERETLNKGDG